MILDNATLLITLGVAVLGFTLQFLLLVLMMVLAAVAQVIVKTRTATARTTIHGARRLSSN